VEIVYNENDGNKGIGFTLNKGIELCNNEIIIKMDSDDIMVPNRIITQMSYMTENPDTHICGAQIEYFNISDRVVGNTDHKSMTWEEYKINPIHWFINHPTLCYRKSSVLEAGNYNKDLREMAEDFDLELRMLKTFGYIHNMSERLLYYRIHDQQVTHNGGKEGKEYWNDVRNDIINKLTS
jgi:glycosyltransferase involved in cell wall biosynthesis